MPILCLTEKNGVAGWIRAWLFHSSNQNSFDFAFLWKIIFSFQRGSVPIHSFWLSHISCWMTLLPSLWFFMQKSSLQLSLISSLSASTIVTSQANILSLRSNDCTIIAVHLPSKFVIPTSQVSSGHPLILYTKKYWNVSTKHHNQKSNHTDRMQDDIIFFLLWQKLQGKGKWDCQGQRTRRWFLETIQRGQYSSFFLLWLKSQMNLTGEI